MEIFILIILFFLSPSFFVVVWYWCTKKVIEEMDKDRREELYLIESKIDELWEEYREILKILMDK